MWLVPTDLTSLQEQTFDVGDQALRLTLRWNSVGQHWAIDVYSVADDAWVVQGVALCVGVPILWRSPVPYFFWLTDESGVGLDPVVQTDLGTRCLLYVALKSEVVP
jgi:hypothetical protein